MSAVVSLKLAPSEFDLLREALEWFYTNQYRTAQDKATDVKLRNKARTQSLLASDLMKKLA